MLFSSPSSLYISSMAVAESTVTTIMKSPSLEHWQAIKPIFVQLYQDEDRTLKEVSSYLIANYGFETRYDGHFHLVALADCSSTKMYKNQIRKWEIDKNIREKDARTILREMRRRHASGKATVCTIRGRLVNLTKVESYIRKKEIDTQALVFEDLTEEMNTHFHPSDVRCFTPLPQEAEDMHKRIWTRPGDLPDHDALRSALTSMDCCTETFWTYNIGGPPSMGQCDSDWDAM